MSWDSAVIGQLAALVSGIPKQDQPHTVRTSVAVGGEDPAALAASLDDALRLALGKKAPPITVTAETAMHDNKVVTVDIVVGEVPESSTSE